MRELARPTCQFRAEAVRLVRSSERSLPRSPATWSFPSKPGHFNHAMAAQLYGVHFGELNCSSC